MSCRSPAASAARSISGSGFKAPESRASRPSGSCFCPAAVAVPTWAELLESSVLAGYLQGPQASDPTGTSSYRYSGFGVHSPEPQDPRLEGSLLGCWGVICSALGQGSKFLWELVFPVFLALCAVTGWLLYSRPRSSAFSTYSWADCQAPGRVFPWIPWLFFFFPKDSMSFIFQYVVWKVSKNALKEHSKKEEVLLLRDNSFLPYWVVVLPFTSSFSSSQKSSETKRNFQESKTMGFMQL